MMILNKIVKLSVFCVTCARMATVVWSSAGGFALESLPFGNFCLNKIFKSTSRALMLQLLLTQQISINTHI